MAAATVHVASERASEIVYITSHEELSLTDGNYDQNCYVKLSVKMAFYCHISLQALQDCIGFCVSNSLSVLICISHSAVRGILDVVYAIDATSPDLTLKEMKSLVNYAVRPLNIKNGDARIGLVSYGKEPIKIVDFANPDKAGLSLALDFIEQQTEKRNTVKAFQYIKDKYFTGPSTRKQARKLIVLFTTGGQEPIDVSAMDAMLKSLNTSDIGYVIINVGGTAMNAKYLTRIGTKYGKIVVGNSNRDIPDALPVVIESGKERLGKTFFIHLSVKTKVIMRTTNCNYITLAARNDTRSPSLHYECHLHSSQSLHDKTFLESKEI